MKKTKLLYILHVPPPAHGAAKVGEFIRHSSAINNAFECRYIPIRSSDTIGEIGKVNLKKFYFVIELYLKVLWALILFRPDSIYFTASVRSVAFYRDLLISTLWKVYTTITPCEIYYHYHTKGIDDFVSASPCNLALTRFFIRHVNLILLSPLLAQDVEKVQTYKKINFLPNGIEDPLANEVFNDIIAKKYHYASPIHILYLAHMMKDKGYVEVLTLAARTKEQPIHYHFAGSWQSDQDEIYFREFVQTHSLQDSVTYYGFVSGEQKKALLQKAHLLLYPSKNDAFPLTLLESLAYGVPVIATPEGSIPYILDDQSGILIHAMNELEMALEDALDTLVNKESANYCRKRYVQNFTLKQFEHNFIRIFND
jgi:glycosyltransferase involved in cell wall biosynthesis